MHPHSEWVRMGLLPQHPEKTIAEMLDEVYEETGPCPMHMWHYYLKLN